MCEVGKAKPTTRADVKRVGDDDLIRMTRGKLLQRRQIRLALIAGRCAIERIAQQRLAIKEAKHM
jgi:hypothetical protein